MAFDPTKFLQHKQADTSTPPTKSDTKTDSDQPSPAPKTMSFSPAKPSDSALKSDPSLQTPASKDSSPAQEPTLSTSPSTSKTKISTSKPEAPSPSSPPLTTKPIEIPSSSPPLSPDPPSPSPTSSTTDSTFPKAQKSEFYSYPIRMVKIDNQWYYSIDDLFDIVNIQKHDQFIGTLQANPELNPKWSQITRSISYQDETGNHTSLFVTKTGAIAIMPHLEQKFPGPFIRWLDRVDKLNRVEVSTKTEPVAYASPPTTG